jgi:hypothetical protein
MTTNSPIPQPPKDHPTFKRMWKILIDDVIKRPNYKKGHLYQLEILCDLYVDLEKLNEIIDVLGYSYESEVARGGGTISRLRPEVQQRNKVLAEIRSYSRILGLLLQKDSELNTDDEGLKDEWD